MIEFANASLLQLGFSWSTVFRHVTVLFVYFAVRISVRGIDEAFELFKGVVITALPVAVIGMLQLVAGRALNGYLAAVTDSPGLERRLALGWPLRATSTIGHWTALSGYLALVIALACALMLWRLRIGEPYGWVRNAIVVLFIAQLATVTFAPIAVSVVVITFAATQMKLRPSHVVAAAAIFTAGYALFESQLSHRLEQQLSAPSRATQNSLLPESVQYRIGIWERETIPAIFDRPMLGWGINVYNRLSTGKAPDQIFWASPESEWMRTAIGQGLPLMCAQLALFLFVLSQMKRVRRELGVKEYRPVVIASGGILIASTFHSHFSSGSVSILFWIAAAAATATLHSSRSLTSTSKALG